MTKLLTPLTQIEGVAAGSTVTVKLPLGRTYNQIFLKHTNITPAQITDIKIKVNGKVIQDYRSGTEYNLIQSFNGSPVLADHLSFDFERPGLFSQQNRRVTAIGTGGESPVTIFQITFKIDAAVVSPAVEGWARTTAGGPLGLVGITRQYNYTVGGAGQTEVSDLPRHALIEKLVIDTSDVTVTNIKIKMDSVDLFDGPPDLFDHISDYGVRVPQTNTIIIDTASDGFGDGMLNAVGSFDFRIVLTTSDGGSLPVTVFYVGGLAD